MTIDKPKFASAEETEQNRQSYHTGAMDIIRGVRMDAHIRDYRRIEASRDDHALLFYGTQSGKVERAQGSAIRI
jgi:hypothetical protein